MSVNVTVEEMEAKHRCAAGQHQLLKLSKLRLSLQKERSGAPRRDVASELRFKLQIPGQPEKWSHTQEKLGLPAWNTEVTPMEHWAHTLRHWRTYPCSTRVTCWGIGDMTMAHWGHISQALRATP